MQRMRYIQRSLHPLFEPEPGFSGTLCVDDPKLGQVDLTFDFNSDECSSHFGLRGRATTVLPVKSEALSQLFRARRRRPTSRNPSGADPLPTTQPSNADHAHNTSTELVTQLYWPEEAHLSEPEILVKVHAIAESDLRVKCHVPDMVWLHRLDETYMTHIRRALGMKDAGQSNRVFYLIIFRKLEPITNLSGSEFRDAWWQIVICHYMLREGGVYHGHVSPSNPMYYRTSCGRVIGVLDDYDLPSIQDDCPRGNERTGTVLFMPIDLLTLSALKGEVEHVPAQY